MATLTIRNVDESVHHQIRRRAAQKSRSMEAEVRDLLAKTYGQASFGGALLSLAQDLRSDVDGVDLVIPPRSVPRILDLNKE
ncbi:MAG: hypothetical protein FWD55_04310 [Propionibacteriaceae bacterium]|nr:hypothetical protein [Propionibacteriaceae bacterium]